MSPLGVGAGSYRVCLQETPSTGLGSIEEGKAGAHTGDTCVVSTLFGSGSETECAHTPVPA